MKQGGQHFKERWKVLLATEGTTAKTEETAENSDGLGGSPVSLALALVRRYRRGLLIACLGIFSVGAAIVHLAPLRASADRRPLHGRVQVNGVQIASGSISFLPAAGNSGPAANASIINGEYNFTEQTGPRSGPHRVLIDMYTPPGQAEAAASEQPVQDMKKVTASTLQDAKAKAKPADAEQTQRSTRRHWELEYTIPNDEDRQDFGLEG